ncbi:unnamed protein product [Wickerhamomyces anomalus]
MSRVNLFVNDGSLVKSVKTLLSLNGKLDKSLKIQKSAAGFIIPTLYESLDQLDNEIRNNNKIRPQLVERVVKDVETSNVIENAVLKYFKGIKISSQESNILLSKIPKKYTIYPPLLLINNQDTFESQEWEAHFRLYPSEEFYKQLLANFPQITHIAINKPIIEQDVMRRPFNISPLFGDFGPEPTSEMFDNPTEKDFEDAFWCTVVQNGIYQTWAPRYTMFSRGNIKEKARVLSFKDVKNTTVVDMYAGIGYFTLSYLKLGAKVFCFEINPWSIQGLIRGVAKNGFSYKVVSRNEEIEWDDSVQCWIFNESNEFVNERLCQTNQHFNISHVNMGLLPSSRQSWQHTLTLVNTFSTTNTTIHIHENESVDNLPTFMNLTAVELTNLALDDKTEHNMNVFPLHLEKIKTFAPGIWHICADFKLEIKN